MYSGQFAKLNSCWSFCCDHQCFVPSPAFGSLAPGLDPPGFTVPPTPQAPRTPATPAAPAPMPVYLSRSRRDIRGSASPLQTDGSIGISPSAALLSGRLWCAVIFPPIDRPWSARWLAAARHKRKCGTSTSSPKYAQIRWRLVHTAGFSSAIATRVTSGRICCLSLPPFSTMSAA
jgi:hypothetical protein